MSRCGELGLQTAITLPLSLRSLATRWWLPGNRQACDEAGWLLRVFHSSAV